MKLTSAKLSQQIFKKIYGKPCWFVRRRPGAGIALEFGQPKLNVKEKVLQANKFRQYPKRPVVIHGDWHLSHFDGDWEIRQGGRKICSTDSQIKKINEGCFILDGQILTEALIDPKSLVTDFYFDLGGHLRTKPHKAKYKVSSMWDLFCPNGRVLSLRSDGKYSYESGSKPVAESHWIAFV